MTKKNTVLILMGLATPFVLALCLLLGAAGVGLPNLRTSGGQAIFTLRVTRVLAGFAVGAALSCAGAVLQALLRNPLAEPYVLGVSSGAGLGAALAIISGLAATAVLATPLCAFVSACLTLATVYVLARIGGRLSIYSLILSGIVVSSVASSLLMFVISLSPVEGLHNVMWWMLGNLEVSSLPLLMVSAALIFPGIMAIWLMAPELNALTLGQEMAHHVGVKTQTATTAGLLLATFVTAASVATAGLIGFVGLIVPHTVRGLVGPDHRRLVPGCALAGGAFLAVCDAIARTALAPREIPVGVVTALIGGPFFMMVLYRQKRRDWVE